MPATSPGWSPARAPGEFAAEIAALAARVDALGERIDRLAKPAPAKRR
jgi:ubiquinone biosynthesis protein UbiJ